ncbi:hypothetical protein [Aminobacterium mobile]|uniref:hypothetical protein n=1 Tax=Aminobacterium mobile TaxID=81467 RepID=UPI002FDA051A
MAFTMKERKAVTRETRAEYKRASERDKKAILDGFIHLTGYNRSYAAYVLRKDPKSARKRSSAIRRKTKPRVYTPISSIYCARSGLSVATAAVSAWLLLCLLSSLNLKRTVSWLFLVQ